MSSRVIFLTSTYDTQRYDISGAKEFGEIIYISNRERFEDFEELGALILQRLHEESFDPDVDYVAMTGSSVLIPILLGVVLAEYGKVKMLTYSFPKKNYLEREVSWDNILEKANIPEEVKVEDE